MSSKYFLVAICLSIFLLQTESFMWYSSSFCQYKCEVGSHLVQKSYYYKTPNGCGSYGFSFQMKFYGLDFNQCCYRHDLCYGSCNSGKQSCDQHLYDCAMSECSRCTVNSVKYVACRSIARVMFKVTQTTGCTAYRRDQEMACSCSK